MKILQVRNVHEALPRAIKLLAQCGLDRPSRNGPVKQAPWPVVTEYEYPTERVLFWPERDANPFFHLYESLWMLAGRNDIAPLTRYAKNMVNFSDNGKTQHGAYGYRWRKYFTDYDAIHRDPRAPKDQLWPIAEQLKRNQEDRRCVLQMWDAEGDLAVSSKDVPCNITATLQRDSDGKLDLTVFCRSNDIVWGAYGANAVHFSVLLEYMANWIGCPVGVYRQVSVNWHGYLNTFTPLLPLIDKIGKYNDIANPYADHQQTRSYPITGEIRRVDELIHSILSDADTGFAQAEPPEEPWARVMWSILYAHDCWRTMKPPHQFEAALEELSRAPQDADWVQAAQQWIERRLQKHEDSLKS